jgi:L-fuconolactonase
LRTVARHGLVLDVPDAWPRHLPATAAVADAGARPHRGARSPGQAPIGRDDFPAWAAALRDLARRCNVVAKLSGLDTATRRHDWTAHDLRPAVDLALESFGPARLMYGGDWPMTVPGGGYASVWSRMRGIVATLSPDERRAVMGGTATRVYGLDLAGPGPAMG